MRFLLQFKAETAESKTDPACKARFLAFRTPKEFIVLMICLTFEDEEVELKDVALQANDDINAEPLFDTDGILQCRRYTMRYTALALDCEMAGFDNPAESPNSAEFGNLHKACALCSFDEQTFVGITPRPRCEAKRLPAKPFPLDREILSNMQQLSGIPDMLFTGRYCLKIENEGIFEMDPADRFSYTIRATARVTFDYPKDREKYRDWMQSKTELRKEILLEAEEEFDTHQHVEFGM